MRYCFALTLYLVTIGSVYSKEVELSVVTESWPPFIVLDKEVSGTATAAVKRILELSGVNYSLNIYPWARSYFLATTQANVLIYSIYKSKNREPLFHWFCPIHESPKVKAFKLTTNKADIGSIEALKNLTVGVMRSDDSYNFLINNGFEEGVNLDVAADEEVNIKKLFMGRIDVVIQAKESFDYRLEKTGKSTSSISEGVTVGSHKNGEHCMALSLDSDLALLNKIRAGFKRWQAENKTFSLNP